MHALVAAVVFELVMIVLAVRANTRFRSEDKLPMQWSLSRGEPLSRSVNWSAPRVLALGFIPFLALCVLASFTFLVMNVKPRPGQEGVVMPTLLFMGTVFVAIQLLHIWLIGKSLRGNDH